MPEANLFGQAVGGLPVPTDLRLPLWVPISTRDGTLGQDGYMQNLFLDVSEDGRKYVQKRPGTSLYSTYGGGGAGTAQGLWYFNGFLVGAADRILSRIISPTSSGFTAGSAWNSLGNQTWRTRKGHVTIVFNDQIFIIGGSYNGAADLADVWSSSDGNSWQQLVSAAPWGGRQLQQAVVLNGELYILGGTGAGVRYNDVWKTKDGVNWTQVTSQAAWSARSSFSACVFNNGIWVLGGVDTINLNDVWFSTDGGTWVQMPVAGWAARNGHSSVVFGGKLYVLGGSVNGREVWYTSDGQSWTMSTALAFSSARYWFGCCVYNGAIWVAGGWDGAAELGQVWKSTASDASTWSQATAAFGGSARFQLGLVPFRAPPSAGSTINAPVLYITGGQAAGPVYKNDVWWASINGTLATTWTIPNPTSTTLRLDAVPVNNNQYFALKDTQGMYIWETDQVTLVVDKNYPTTTVPGVVNLDETVYVMTPDGLIVGSENGNPYTWPSRNFIGADYESDGGVALAKYSNYVVAFGVYTTQFFYTSGSPSATTLRPQKNLNTRVGCAFPAAIVSNENTLMYLGRTEQTRDCQVFHFVGGGVAPVSTPWVEKIINLWTPSHNVWAMAVKAKGHTFYVLSNSTANLSLAYDLDTKVWTRWVYVGAYWSLKFTATDGTNNFVSLESTKTLYSVDQNVRSDAGSAIVCQVVTNKTDNGTNKWKQCSAATIIADISGSNATIEYSDDDYTTWSTALTVSLAQTNKARARAGRLGKYRRRAWRITHTSSSQDFRAEALETDLRLGSS